MPMLVRDHGNMGGGSGPSRLQILCMGRAASCLVYVECAHHDAHIGGESLHPRCQPRHVRLQPRVRLQLMRLIPLVCLPHLLRSEEPSRVLDQLLTVSERRVAARSSLRRAAPRSAKGSAEGGGSGGGDGSHTAMPFHPAHRRRASCGRGPASVGQRQLVLEEVALAHDGRSTALFAQQPLRRRRAARHGTAANDRVEPAVKGLALREEGLRTRPISAREGSRGLVEAPQLITGRGGEIIGAQHRGWGSSIIVVHLCIWGSVQASPARLRARPSDGTATCGAGSGGARRTAETPRRRE